MAQTSNLGGGGGNPSSAPILPPTFSAAVLHHLQRAYAAQPRLCIPCTSRFRPSVSEDSEHDGPGFDAFLAYMSLAVADAQGPLVWEAGGQRDRMVRDGREGEGEEEDEEGGRARLGWPMSSYFVSSSHNTYLTGNQLSSQASGDAYRNVRVFFSVLFGRRGGELLGYDGEGGDGYYYFIGLMDVCFSVLLCSSSIGMRIESYSECCLWRK